MFNKISKQLELYLLLPLLPPTSARSQELAADLTVYLWDDSLSATYFIHWVESSFHLVTICEGRRGEKDGAINTFIQETVGQLRSTRLFNSLKPGYK